MIPSPWSLEKSTPGHIKKQNQFRKSLENAKSTPQMRTPTLPPSFHRHSSQISAQRLTLSTYIRGPMEDPHRRKVHHRHQTSSKMIHLVPKQATNQEPMTRHQPKNRSLMTLDLLQSQLLRNDLFHIPPVLIVNRHCRYRVKKSTIGAPFNGEEYIKIRDEGGPLEAWRRMVFGGE